jgi:hypothetical protein
MFPNQDDRLSVAGRFLADFQRKGRTAAAESYLRMSDTTRLALVDGLVTLVLNQQKGSPEIMPSDGQDSCGPRQVGSVRAASEDAIFWGMVSREFPREASS